MRRVLIAAAGGAVLAAGLVSTVVGAANALPGRAVPQDVVATPGVTVQIPESATPTSTPAPGGGTGSGGTGSGGTGSGGSGGTGSGGTDSGGTGSGGTGTTDPSQPTPTRNRLLLRPWRIHPGDAFTAEGAGYTPGETIDVVIFPGPRRLTTVVADARGEFLAHARLARTTSPGMYPIQATGRTSHRVAANELAVAAPILPQSSWWGWVIVGGGVLCGIGALVLTVKLGGFGAWLAAGAGR